MMAGHLGVGGLPFCTRPETASNGGLQRCFPQPSGGIAIGLTQDSEWESSYRMFIVKITYTVPLETVDKHLPAHVEWLHKHEAEGKLIVYGRLVPRTGGVIMARTKDRAELDALLACDPFRINKVGTYEVIEFSENKSFAEKARKMGIPD